jgi:putative toxin-antitoxin system antitoxin component (TIGR02293 family)
MKNQEINEEQNLVREVAVKYEVNEENQFSLVNKAQLGLPASAFFDLQEITKFSNQELAGLLNISFKTIQRYEKEGKHLSAQNSEQLLKIIALYQKAEQVFGSLESFNRWLRKPAPGLRGQKPFSLMQTSGGIDLVREEVIRIEFGALA